MSRAKVKTSAICTGLKLSWLEFMATRTYKAALFSSDAPLTETAPAYTSDHEVKGDGYTAGGVILRGFTFGAEGAAVFASWDNIRFENSSIRARKILIYDSATLAAVHFIELADDLPSSDGLWEYRFPEANAETAHLVIN